MYGNGIRLWLTMATASRLPTGSFSLGWMPPMNTGATFARTYGASGRTASFHKEGSHAAHCGLKAPVAGSTCEQFFVRVASLNCRGGGGEM